MGFELHDLKEKEKKREENKQKLSIIAPSSMIPIPISKYDSCVSPLLLLLFLLLLLLSFSELQVEFGLVQYFFF